MFPSQYLVATFHTVYILLSRYYFIIRRSKQKLDINMQRKHLQSGSDLQAEEKAAPVNKKTVTGRGLRTEDAGQLFSILTEDRRKRKWVLTAGGGL